MKKIMHFLTSLTNQTHYYGAKITNGEDAADIHGSLLCLWAVFNDIR